MELIQRFIDGFAAGDDDAQTELMHPDVELTEWPEAPDSNHVRGIAEVRRIRDAWFDAWDSLEFTVDEYLEVRGRVISCGRAHALGKGSTVPVDFENYAVFTIRDGKVARVEFFMERAQALAAAGQPESQEAR